MAEKSDETFLDLGVNLDDVPDLSTVPGGEYQLQIVDIGITETEKGKFLIPRLEIVGKENVKDITAPLRIPDSTMNDKERARRQRNIKAFYKAFGIPTDGRPLVFNECVGKIGWATLTEDEDPKYGKQNQARQWLGKK